MMRLMKDSGIAWLGQVPREWQVERLQWYVREVKESNNPIKTTQVLSLTNNRGVIPYEEKGAQGNVAKEDYSQYKVAYPNTIIANSMNILIGSVGMCVYYGCVSPVYYVYKILDTADIRFINYIFQTVQFQKELRKYANGILEIRLRVTSADILKREIAIPPLAEQQAIADYLDEKCAAIDKLIDNQKAQIEKMKEYKQSVITEAVTKGLNPSVPMKDSGIEWIGKIPEEWGEVMLSSLFCEHKQKNEGMQCNNLLSLSYGKIIRKSIDTSEGLLPGSFEGYNIIDKGDIVLRLTDLQNDHKSLRTGLATERGIITSAYVTIRLDVNEIASSKYMHYFLHSFDVAKGFYGMGDGVRQSLPFEGCKKITLLLPPLAEQQAIADYLDEKCAAIDKLIAIKQAKIDKLNDYKKSLIYEYVTGKREVL